MFSEIIIGSRDVQMKVDEHTDHLGATVVHLSGHIIHSSCTIRSIRIVEAPEALRVLILIGIVRPGEKGAFRVDVPVDENIHRICLGTDESAVWLRELVVGTAAR